MADQYKFSVVLKPRALDRLMGASFVDDRRYAEYLGDALSEYWYRLGMRLSPNLLSMLVKVEGTYMTPFGIHEEANIYTRISKIGRTSAVHEYQINEAISGRPIASFAETRVWVDAKTHRPTPWPEEWKQKVIAFEGKENVKVA